MKVTAALAAVVSVGICLLPTGLSHAAEDSAFGPKPWLLSSPPEKLTPLQKQRASSYKSNLQREIRTQELKGPQTNVNGITRLKTFRSELSRIKRTSRSRRTR